MSMALRQVLGLPMSGAGISSAFNAPLTHSLKPLIGVDAVYSRASAGTVFDHEGVLKEAKAGESRFTGTRVVDNVIENSNDFSGANWLTAVGASVTGTNTINLPVENSQVYQNVIVPTGSQIIYSIYLSGSGTVTILFLHGGTEVQVPLTSIPTRYWIKATTTSSNPNFYIYKRPGDTATEVTAGNAQVEHVGSSQTAPSEYVSRGVLPAPYHGAGVDGVKNFDTSLPYGSAGVLTSTNVLLGSENLLNAAWNAFNGATIDDFKTISFPVTLSNVRQLYTHSGVGTAIDVTGSYTVSGTGVIELIMNEADNTTVTKVITLTSTPTTHALNLVVPVADGDFVRFYIRRNDGQGATATEVTLHNSQLEQYNIATPYIPTTTVPVTRYGKIHPAILKGILLEEESTNIALDSELIGDITNWNVGEGIKTITLNDAVAPDGTNTAARLEFDNGNCTLAQLITGLVDGEEYTFSIYLKAPVAGDWAINMFNDVSHVRTLVAVTTEWKRFDMTVTAGITAQVYIYAGDNRDGTNTIFDVHAWGAQLENLPYSTSYIKTTTAAATRIPDVLSYDFQPNALAGSMLATINDYYRFSHPSTTYAIAGDNLTRFIYNITSGDMDSYDGVNSGSYNIVTNDPNADKFGLVWDAGTLTQAPYSNGVKQTESALQATGYVMGSLPLGIGSRSNGLDSLTGNYRDIVFYNKALPQAIMEDKTS